MPIRYSNHSAVSGPGPNGVAQSNGPFGYGFVTRGRDACDSTTLAVVARGPEARSGQELVGGRSGIVPLVRITVYDLRASHAYRNSHRAIGHVAGERAHSFGPSDPWSY